MKFADIKNLKNDELRKQVSELRVQLFEAKMKQSLGQLNNTDRIRRIRRNIARYKTCLLYTSPSPRDRG